MNKLNDKCSIEDVKQVNRMMSKIIFVGTPIAFFVAMLVNDFMGF